MTLMLIFGGAAILLAAVGIYGVVAYAVSQRRNEMATRLALGATPASVFSLILKQASSWPRSAPRSAWDLPICQAGSCRARSTRSARPTR